MVSFEEQLDHLQQAIGRHESHGQLAFKMQNLRAEYERVKASKVDKEQSE